MSNYLFLVATNVHQGGGLSLLMAVINSLPDDGSSRLFLDERVSVQAAKIRNSVVNLIKPTIFHRFNAEMKLKNEVKCGDVVLCFGNLPPLFRLNGRTVVFLQNRYLVEDVPLNGFPLVTKVRLLIERMWLSIKSVNVDEFIVQTPTMKMLLEKKIRTNISVRVIPFAAQPNGFTRSFVNFEKIDNSVYDFLYVASGEPHKNHRCLIQAWCLLAADGFFPTLCLTLDENSFVELCEFIEIMRNQYGVKIVNVGSLSHHDVIRLYKESGALIYPSKFESFGLPLIEARQAGLPILASELDYVRDLVDPEHVFDPDSRISISRAVKRFMGVDDSTLTLLNATQFLSSIFQGKPQ